MTWVKRPTYKLMAGGRCVQTASTATVLLPNFRRLTKQGYKPAIHWTGDPEQGSLQGLRSDNPGLVAVWCPHPYNPDNPVPEWAQTIQRVIQEGAI